MCAPHLAVELLGRSLLAKITTDGGVNAAGEAVKKKAEEAAKVAKQAADAAAEAARKADAERRKLENEGRRVLKKIGLYVSVVSTDSFCL